MDQWDDVIAIFEDKETIDRSLRGSPKEPAVAWPSMLQIIRGSFQETCGIKALDVGCGTGEYCAGLKELGFDVSCVDITDGVLLEAGYQKILPMAVEIEDGTKRTQPPAAAASRHYELVTAAMVLHFVEDAEDMLQAMDEVLLPFGVLVFSVFNPRYVASCLRSGGPFVDFDSIRNPRRGFMKVSDKFRLPIHLREPQEYVRMLEYMGYRRMAFECPPLAADFCEDYHMDFVGLDPVFQVFGFRKMALASIRHGKK